MIDLLTMKSKLKEWVTLRAGRRMPVTIDPLIEFAKELFVDKTDEKSKNEVGDT